MAQTEKTSAQVVSLDARKQRGAVDGANTEAKQTRYGYRVAGVGFLVAEGVTSEVLITPGIYSVPMAPAWLLGLSNVRGNIVPVFNLAHFIAPAISINERRTVLILSACTGSAGIVIDGLPEPVPVDGARVTAPAINGALRSFLSTGVRALQCDWWEFDFQSFFSRLAGAPAPRTTK